MLHYVSQRSQNICRFNPTAILTPAALDDVGNGTFMLSSTSRVNLVNNFITASTAAVVSSFPFVFVAYTSENGEHFMSGVSVLLCTFVRSYNCNFCFSLMLEAYLAHLVRAMGLIREGYWMDQWSSFN